MSLLLRPSSYCSAGELLFLNEELSNLTIVVKANGSHWHFPVHSLMLAAQSSVFRTLLKAEPSAGNKEIVVENMTPSTTEQLLRYIYCGKIELENWTEGIDLLQAAFNYKVEPLVQKCGRFLEDVISLSNVCYIYNKAASCSLPPLQDKCLKLILDAGFVVLRSKAFEILSKDCAMDIISSPDLNVDSELIVFETLLRWARLECCRTGQLVTEANILSELKPFLQHVCVDDMSDADKSALPPSVLSCVKPNNRNRVGFAVLDSLLIYSQSLDFEVNQNCLDFVGDNLCCVRFSIDSPIYLVGFHFTLVAMSISSFPLHLPLTLMKENSPKSTLFTYNLSTAHWTEGICINQRKWHDAEVLLRQPVQLQADDIYNLYVVDVGSDAQCPRMTLPMHTLWTASGQVNFSIHGEEMWGIASFIFI